MRATVTDQQREPRSPTPPSPSPVWSIRVNGNLSQASAVTDTSGQATVQYISGAGTTADAGVQLRASILTDPTVFGDATMTVTQGALFIGLGTGNVISNLDPQTYKKDWVVYVTDSNGVAVANKDLTIKVLPVEYRKGHLVFNTVWTYDLATLQTCANEDTDYTGFVTPAKDFNGSGNLQPGNVVLVTTTQTTNGGRERHRPDGSRRAGRRSPCSHAESYSPWVKVRLTAQATVSGNRVVERAGVHARRPGRRLHQRDQSAAQGRPAPFGVNPCNVPN